ncbi:LpqB family beta-propeller domain-containing protein [Streptomyces sp. NK08204]|uniref:LpqB family beta-propeller domain-containing protein n=1 Tax=Streptomyces sp. NK08204 TaxID=2873260 RepID=UPI001CEC48AF|nr:LpqB family beta-propeller domain-containing protein [Streptomyces sp. NK08204]
MGAEREGGARRRPGRAMACMACGVVLLAGCASMPDNGDLRSVESTPRQDTGVRVFAMPPAEGAQPGEIVQGFLEALTSDDPNYDTARKYLSADAARHWRPKRSTVVLANGPSSVQATNTGGREGGTGGLTYVLAGTRVAKVDAQQAYAPASGPYSRTVHLSKDSKSGQWRIDELDDGVVMGKSDFQRNYTSVDKYYFASNTAVGATGQPVAVADPVFVRSKVDPMTQMVRSLLKGPTRWLRPVVRSSFPTGTGLQPGVSGLAPDDQNKLTVPLKLKASRVAAGTCTEMATQVLFTLRNLTPTLQSVELQGTGGEPLCELSEERAEAEAWHGSAKRHEYLYYLDGRHRLVRLLSEASGTSAVPVPGVLGEGARAVQSVAVSRDERSAAVVGGNGRRLFVTSLASGGSLGNPVLTSQGLAPADGLTTPSWDARGDLWVADRATDRQRLYVLEPGVAKPEEVTVPDLPGRLVDVRVAADGVRVALVVEKDGKQSLLIGRVERGDRTGQGLAVGGLRSAAPDLEQVSALSWAGDSRLVVFGREQGGLQQLRYVQIDGSTLDGPAPGALTGVKTLAASEEERLPLVAYSKEDGIVRLLSGAQWQKVDKDGQAPAYPG